MLLILYIYIEILNLIGGFEYIFGIGKSPDLHVQLGFYFVHKAMGGALNILFVDYFESNIHLVKCSIIFPLNPKILLVLWIFPPNPTDSLLTLDTLFKP